MSTNVRLIFCRGFGIFSTIYPQNLEDTFEIWFETYIA